MLFTKLMKFYKDNPEFSRIEVKISFEGTTRQVTIEGFCEPTGDTFCVSGSAQEGKDWKENEREESKESIAMYNICDEAETGFLHVAMKTLAMLDEQQEDQS